MLSNLRCPKKWLQEVKNTIGRGAVPVSASFGALWQWLHTRSWTGDVFKGESIRHWHIYWGMGFHEYSLVAINSGRQQSE